ncbi:NAD-dependent epimerase/dehydratase family protein [Flavobacteriaceae bacterium]|nr:NAD-dependent epimerase/dehydratase family protein [Flavobacteriaceae bacterium]MDC0097209.1 NAD-dependent epimerase/dehydratase family protein [Flavobacteriaceae bacterium]
MEKRILIIGASGQIGNELTMYLRNMYSNQNVIASDIREASNVVMESGPFEILDAMDYPAIEKIVTNYNITDVYLMAAMLSATAEKYPIKGWDLNMTSLFNVLNLAKDKKIEKVFWPSSIAVFGPTTPKTNTPQHTIMEPATVYGISKQTGERWCEYYHKRYGVDVRSIRYPGLISYKTPPGGGTTDYAIDIFHKALKDKKYTCFLTAQTALPMMFMDDAINATVNIMLAPPQKIKIRNAYNLAALSFNPQELAASIQKHIPDFTINYKPDFRQAIADSWPASIDDAVARKDWGWQHTIDLDKMTKVMIDNLK